MHEWREIEEIDKCPHCGHDFLVFTNKANQKAWAFCYGCDAEIKLQFSEPYNGAKHGYYARTGYSTSYHSAV